MAARAETRCLAFQNPKDDPASPSKRGFASKWKHFVFDRRHRDLLDSSVLTRLVQDGALESRSSSLREMKSDCCVLNEGDGAWAFQPLAEQLSRAIGIDISTQTRRFNYLLHADGAVDETARYFIPLDSIRIAADKRLLAEIFEKHCVPRPETRVFDQFEDALEFVRSEPTKQWCLKFPTGCGGSGHQMLTGESQEDRNWPKPFVVQEFIALANPEVFRTYAAGGQVFGWVVRRYPEGVTPSPWVAHARGARYVCLDEIPQEALSSAKAAFQATGLLESFGCADLLQKPNGDWVVLEVGTDGLHNHVDRELDHESFEQELNIRLNASFWRWIKSSCGSNVA